MDMKTVVQVLYAKKPVTILILMRSNMVILMVCMLANFVELKNGRATAHWFLLGLSKGCGCNHEQ